MMAESIDSRKFERKQTFDVPLPMRKAQREASSVEDSSEPAQTPQSTMAFSLMTKRGNRQQVGVQFALFVQHYLNTHSRPEPLHCPPIPVLRLQ